MTAANETKSGAAPEGACPICWARGGFISGRDCRHDAPNIYQRSNRAVKVTKLIHAAEAFLALGGITDFAAPRLADVVAEWGGEVWTRLSLISRVSPCAEVAKGERVCAACKADVIEDFKSRPALAAAIARMER